MAVGRPGMSRETGSSRVPWVIDVGINRIADGRLIMTSTDGGVAERARGITPVLAGGPMTAVTLMQHGQAAEQG